jgi:hypothetical protein
MPKDPTVEALPCPAPSLNQSIPEVPFGVNEVRLNARQWLVALSIIGLVVLLTPRVWQRLEHFDTGPDYRIPYQLSKDYWFYGQWLRHAANSNKVVLLGDSVVWGEYVSPDGTLSHFLNQEAGTARRFINAGVNGLFPLAQDGLLHYYAPALQRRKVVLQCNVLWMTSPKADLSTHKEEQFNHSRLVPQFFPRIPCYRADANERLSAIVERQVGFIAWVGHLQSACFGQQSIPTWTLQMDAGNPPRCPNAWRNPLAQITFGVPSAPKDDPQRGPGSPRHKPWFDDGDPGHSSGAAPAGTTRFEWVDLDASLQWRAFQRVVGRLRERGNDVVVVLGPFNQHIMVEENRPAYLKLREGIAAWLTQAQVPHIVPKTLPSALYADASHPLTAGYELLAKRLYADHTFQEWLSR